MTVCSIQATSSSKTVEFGATISEIAHRPCATSITGWARSTAPFSQKSLPDKSTTSQTSIRTCSRTAILRLSRYTSAFTKSALPQAYATQSIFSVRNGLLTPAEDDVESTEPFPWSRRYPVRDLNRLESFGNVENLAGFGAIRRFVSSRSC